MNYPDPGARFVIDRATIRMPYVADARARTISTWPVITPRAPLWARRIVEQLGLQFRRETHFDSPPYLAEDDGPVDDVILLTSSKSIAYAQLIVGAVAVNAYDADPYITWAYVHPYERGRGLIDRQWPSIQARYPTVRLYRDPANTPAGNALLSRLAAQTR